MASPLKKGESKISQGFVLTSKVFSTPTFEMVSDTKDDFFDDYNSTVKQTSVASKEQNDAIRNIACANFALYTNKSIQRFNKVMKKELMAV